MSPFTSTEAQRGVGSRAHGAARRQVGQLVLVAITLLPSSDLRLALQAVSVNVVGDAVGVRASAFGFIKGDTLKRLRDGRSVRVDLELRVLPGPGASPVAQNRQTFVLSYDLWEERFAVAQPAVPSRSISHVTLTGAEAWCVEQMTIPIKTLGRLGTELPFWIRLEYRVLDGDTTPPAEDETGFTLRGLIDALSRRRRVDDASDSIEAGPFRLRD